MFKTVLGVVASIGLTTGTLAEMPSALYSQDSPGVRLQENADCGGRGFGVNPPRDVADFNQFGVSCIDVIARTPQSWVVFYSQTNFRGSELRVRGAWRNANIADIVKKNGPCVLGATTAPPGNWNDEIRSFRFVDSYDADGCGTNCPPPGINGRCGPAVGIADTHPATATSLKDLLHSRLLPLRRTRE
jgi:hypothetical protein